MSAFGDKADMTICGSPLSRSLLWVKQTCHFALMSAYDPKRTSATSGRPPEIGTMLFSERRGGDDATPIHRFARWHASVAFCGACAATGHAGYWVSQYQSA